MQAKLSITPAGDRHEQEADHLATQVVQRIHQKTTPTPNPSQTIQAKPLPPQTTPTPSPLGTTVTPQIETAIRQQRGQGQPLPTDIREPLEQAFQTDFSPVRIHTDEKSHQLNHSIHALAFTTGQDIFFKRGKYQPHSRQGQELLAHELTHVVQQNSRARTIQRKGDRLLNTLEQAPAILSSLVEDISQEISSFSATWLESTPTEIELFPWLKITQPELKLDQKDKNYELDIQGRVELNLGSDLATIKPEGTFKINYQSQTKKWDYKTENIGIDVQISNILQFNATNLQYDRTQKSIIIGQAGLKIPELNNVEATVSQAKIDPSGLNWKEVQLKAPDLALGNYVSLTNAQATIAGASEKYKSKFEGDFGINLGSPDLLALKGKGHLTVTYEEGKWGCQQKDVGIEGTIANLLNFSASNIQYDHSSKTVTIEKAGISVPDLNNITATVSQAKIDPSGLNWEQVQLKAPKLALGNYVSLTNAQATIAGASEKYKSKFEGDFCINLGSPDLLALEGKGHLTVTYEEGQWGCQQKDVGITGTIANLLNFSASNIQYDHSTKTVTIEKAGISVPDLNNITATVSQAKIDPSGLHWEQVQLKAPKLALGNYVSLTNAQATIAGVSEKYKSKFEGDFGINLGSPDLLALEGKGHLTVTYEEGQWGCQQKDVGITGTIANLLNFSASNIQYDHSTKTVTIEEAGISVPDLNNITATVSQAKIDPSGLHWEQVQLKAPKLALGNYVSLTNAQATIAGVSEKYKSKFEGDFGINLGSPDLLALEGKGHLTVTYEEGKWGCQQKDVGITGTIANLLNFSASNIQYDHSTKTVTIEKAGISVPDLNNITATVSQAKINHEGLNWEQVQLKAPKLALGNYVSLTNAQATIAGASEKYKSKFEGDFGINLGSPDLLALEGKGHLTVTYEEGKWGCQQKDVGITGTIANLLNFSASNIQYDHSTKTVTIEKAGISVPDLNNITATVSQAKINQEGLNWEQVQLKAPKLALGNYVSLTNAQATIAGASEKYKSKFEGDFGINLGSPDLLALEGKGHLTVTYEEGKWGCQQKDVGITGTIANLLNFSASNIQYDHSTKTVTIEKAGISVPDLNNITATVSQAKIDPSGLHWEQVQLKAPKLALGNYVSLDKAKATIGGASEKYKSKFEGDFGINLGSSDLLALEGTGHLILSDQEGKWECQQKNVGITGTIANLLNFSASNIQYDHSTKTVTIEEAGISVPDPNNAQVSIMTTTVSQAKIDQSGLDWAKIELNIPELALGNYVSLAKAKATIGGASEKYKSKFEGNFGINLGSPDLLALEGTGHLTLSDQEGKWECQQENVGIEGTIAQILNFKASNIQYDHSSKTVSVQQAGISVPKLNNAQVTVTKVEINQKGLDWETVTVSTDTISIGNLLAITNPTVTVEGQETQYSTTASGGVELNCGKYLTAKGTGMVKLDRTQANNKGKLKVEKAELTVKGSIQLPGDSVSWPNISLDYPIVPGVEAGLELGINGGIGASLAGSIAKQAIQDWQVGVNPEINGFLAVSLKAKAGVGSAYIAAIQAFVAGKCQADFRGGLKLEGLLKYDEESHKVDASQLKSQYYAKAEFKVEVSAGVQAQALYLFTKNLYRIRAKCSLGGGGIEGLLEFDENGKLEIGKPKFSGVIAGSFDKESIKLEERSYELITPEKADALLQDAATHIAGSGEKRKQIINGVKAEYIRVLNETKGVIKKEEEKSQKYLKNLSKIDIKLSRYHDLIQLAKKIEQEETRLETLETQLEQELAAEEAKLNEQEITEMNKAEETWNKDKPKSDKSSHSVRNFFKDTFHTVKEGTKEVFETAKDIFIPDVLRDTYHEIKDKYDLKKQQLKERINNKRNEIRIRYTEIKKSGKDKCAKMKLKAAESFPDIADQISEIKTKASDLKAKASDFKNHTKESIKEKTLVKLTELGIKDTNSFVKRINKLTELQIKYSEKHELHSQFLQSAIEAREKATTVLQDVEAAIANLQNLELGQGMNNIAEMNKTQEKLNRVEQDLLQDMVKLDDDFEKQIAAIEKEIANSLG
ncbi:DUF4157 domain-containing protein [Spirulina subsalsa FACHB-351]|uniref:DUF4157 domain-containing protein n=1 Tax=Spirulina subsalsa FACHB-351 TaxID=234711 RepID=A0ABT3L7T7_9CYAN|nr:DUF4157 domain-containing protein [Spirulina subsalsa]MCW6037559.1 DUF4157 domain-containing protein [Spirulina subsalsa FACHB-351]